MDVYLDKIYSFDEKAKDSTACVQECGNSFRLMKIHIDLNAFHPEYRDVRFEFLCRQCGSTVFLAHQLEVEKFHPIVERDRIEGIHLSFWAGMPLGFDYTNGEDKKESYTSSLGKGRKKPINPNRIFRDRKRLSGFSFKHSVPPTKEMNAFDTSFIPQEQIVQRNISAGGKVVIEYTKKNGETIMRYETTDFPPEVKKAIHRSHKYESLARSYARPESMYEKSEELVDLTIPEELSIPIQKEGGWIRSKNEQEMIWKEGKAINWEEARTTFIDQLKVDAVQEKSAEKKMDGDVPSDLEYDEFFDYNDFEDNDTSHR